MAIAIRYGQCESKIPRRGLSGFLFEYQPGFGMVSI
jgi:hypothetical protein